MIFCKNYLVCDVALKVNFKLCKVIKDKVSVSKSRPTYISTQFENEISTRRTSLNCCDLYFAAIERFVHFNVQGHPKYYYFFFYPTIDLLIK